MNSEYEEFGIQRLKDLLSELAGKSSQQIVETIKATIKDFENDTEQSDDITMLVIKRKGNGL